MRERIEQVGDILLAAAHADHHVEATEIDKIEEILRALWREEPTPDSLVRRVTEFREGDRVDEEEMRRLGSMLRDLQPREELPASLVARLADFDPARFDIDEAVGPFLHEGVEFKRRLLELAVAVHEADGELDFAEDTFIRELGFKLGLDLSQFGDLLLEFLPAEAPAARDTDPPATVTSSERPAPPEPIRPQPEPGANGRRPAAPEETGDVGEREEDWTKISEVEAVDRGTYEGMGAASDAATEARDLGSDAQTELLVPPSAGEPGNLLAPTSAARPRPARSAGARAAGRKDTPAAPTGEPGASRGTPVARQQKKAAPDVGKKTAEKKAPSERVPASKKAAARSTAAEEEAASKKKVAKKKVARKKAATIKASKKKVATKKATSIKASKKKVATKKATSIKASKKKAATKKATSIKVSKKKAATKKVTSIKASKKKAATKKATPARASAGKNKITRKQPAPSEKASRSTKKKSGRKRLRGADH